MQENHSGSKSGRTKRLSFDVAANWAVVLTFAAAIIAFIPLATIPFLYTKVTVLALGVLATLILFILARLTRGNAIIPPLPLLGALWIVPAAYLLSSLFSGAGMTSSFFGTEIETDTAGFVVLLALFATLTALAFRRIPSYRMFFAAGAIVSAAVVAIQVLVVITSRIAPTLIAPTTNLVGSFMDLGMFLGLGLAIGLLAFRLLTLSAKVRTMMLVAGGVALFLLALVNSVLIWTLVALVALALFIEAIMRNRPSGDQGDLDGVALLLAEDTDEPTQSSRSLAAPLATLAVALFFLIGGGTIGSALATGLGVDVIDVRPSWQSTFDIGSHTYASSPLFGSGPGTFGTQWVQFRDRSLNDTYFWNVDFVSGIGSIPTSFVTTGLVGALAWVAFIGLFLFFGIRALLLRLPEDPFVRFVSAASFTGALYVLALAIFTVPGPIVFLAGFLLIGVFISSLRYGTNAREVGIIFARSPKVGFVIVFALTLLLLASILAAYVVIERYLGGVAYAESTTALSSGDLDKALEAANRSILFSPSDRAYQLISGIGISRMNQVASNTELPQADAQSQFQAALSGSIEAALAATQIGPNNYQNWAMLGNVYQTVVPLNIEGAYENAKTAYQQAVALNPTSPALPYVIAQLEIAHKDPAAASAALMEAITLKRDYTQAIFLLSQLEVQQGRAREALEAAEAAAYFAPNDPTILFQVGILRSANGNNPGAIQALARSVEINPQYANARFFLGVMYAISGQFEDATRELEQVGTLSPENAEAVAADLAAVRAGRNPFPPTRLGALGIPQGALGETTAPAR
ncbi:MAG: Tfp pilus assembly protein PilF [Patescibacteria group bacterium]|jgi:tetratricopeptide (TPR) repeat protein|nr:Tfp pilus assembly protein PilF [Patescibacteria group bacterium]